MAEFTIVKGNDFDLTVAVSLYDDEAGSYAAYDISDAKDMVLALVGRTNIVKATDIQIDGNRVTGRISGKALKLGTYGVQLTCSIGSYSKRAYECAIIKVVNCNDETDVTSGGTEAEEGYGINLYLMVSSDHLYLVADNKQSYIVADSLSLISDPKEGDIAEVSGVTYEYINGEWVLRKSLADSTDEVPTADSDNLVKSGGVYAALLSKHTHYEVSSLDSVSNPNEGDTAFVAGVSEDLTSIAAAGGSKSYSSYGSPYTALRLTNRSQAGMPANTLYIKAVAWWGTTTVYTVTTEGTTYIISDSNGNEVARIPMYPAGTYVDLSLSPFSLAYSIGFENEETGWHDNIPDRLAIQLVDPDKIYRYSGGAWVQYKERETTDNKVTSLSSASTHDQYPSAKCVYDIIGDVETLLANI